MLFKRWVLVYPKRGWKIKQLQKYMYMYSCISIVQQFQNWKTWELESNVPSFNVFARLNNFKSFQKTRDIAQRCLFSAIKR